MLVHINKSSRRSDGSRECAFYRGVWLCPPRRRCRCPSFVNQSITEQWSTLVQRSRAGWPSGWLVAWSYVTISSSWLHSVRLRCLHPDPSLESEHSAWSNPWWFAIHELMVAGLHNESSASCSWPTGRYPGALGGLIRTQGARRLLESVDLWFHEQRRS